MSPGLGDDDRPGRSGRAVRQGVPDAADHGRVRLTAKRVERPAEASGTAKAAAVLDRARAITARTLVPLPPSPLPDKLYAAIDGTGVPMTSRETAGRDGKGADGRARTREIKLAVFFTQDKVDDDGYPVRDRDSSSYIATFEPARVFADLVKAEGTRRGAEHVRQFTILGDGAAWTWNIANAKFPEATQIVDIYHAREHLHDLARQLEFMLGDRKDEWLAARLEDLDYGDIDGICRAARAYPLEGVKKEELDTALGYFENNAPRMRYHWFRQCGPVHRLRCRGGELQDDHRPAPQIIRHALDRQRGQRYRHPALSPGQLPRPPHLEADPPPDRRRLTASAKVPAAPPTGYPPVTHKICPAPRRHAQPAKE
jgi:hypothetical protein